MKILPTLLTVIFLFCAYRAIKIIINTIQKEKASREDRFNPSKETIEEWMARRDSKDPIDEIGNK